ncbi:hypothetical protein D3874_03295 [Oleomonas cavernae]|uniref:Uncharacterized protein n=1 Tax=Oleomonas cavernae TaxID=2320859 RepID=A0A418WUB1_9PROT|nr:hypothetical protein [Oleomonas cavernae]RJF94852.1 hypothetical protein D3874_03295 [Oleomonas cavernae]
MGLLLKIAAILIGLGLLYVSIKRLILGNAPRKPEVPPAKPSRPESLTAEDLERCPRCGAYVPKNHVCERS